MASPGEEQPPHRSRKRWPVVAAALSAVVVLLAATAIGGWHFSSAVLIPDRSGWKEESTISGLAAGEVTLAASTETTRPGTYGLAWQSGHAILGEVLQRNGSTVTRRMCPGSGYLAAGMKVAIDSDVYGGDPSEAGLRFQTVNVNGELGAMPAWYVPGRSDTWAIIVHGINGDPRAGLRLAPFFHAGGLPLLLIRYREDLGAPASPDRFHHMGLTEWRDLQSAVRYAISHGARAVVLVGYSMGGAIVTQFIEHSALRANVAGLVLDAPALSWKAILSFNAKQMGLPSFAALPVEWAIGERINADWDQSDALRHPGAFHLPILLFHGTDDHLVPIETSDQFARELRGSVTYYRVPHAGHTQAWNVNPTVYEERLSSFLHRAAGLRASRALGSPCR